MYGFGSMGQAAATARWSPAKQRKGPWTFEFDFPGSPATCTSPSSTIPTINPIPSFPHSYFLNQLHPPLNGLLLFRHPTPPLIPNTATPSLLLPLLLGSPSPFASPLLSLPLSSPLSLHVCRCALCWALRLPFLSREGAKAAALLQAPHSGVTAHEQEQ